MDEPTTPPIDTIPVASPPKNKIKLSVILPVLAMVLALPILVLSTRSRKLTNSNAANPATYCGSLECITPATYCSGSTCITSTPPTFPTPSSTPVVIPTYIIPSPTPSLRPTPTPTPMPTIVVYPIPSPTPTVIRPTTIITTVIENPTIIPIPSRNSLPQITSSPTVISWQVGKLIKFTITGTDANLTDTMTMSATGLPNGLTLNSCTATKTSTTNNLTCTVSGTPTKNGVFTTTVALLDSQRGVAKKVIYFYIYPSFFVNVRI